MTALQLAAIDDALAEMSAGRPVIVVDDPARENEGDLVFAAEKANRSLLAFAIRYTSGLICAPTSGQTCDRLELPPMHHTNEDPRHTAYTVSVDARHGITTGISADDRATTLRLIAAPGTSPNDLRRPGHVFPLRARAGGVLDRAGHTEAAVDLARLAGLQPVGVIAELVNDDGTMQRMPQLSRFASTHRLALITIEQLIAYRLTRERNASCRSYK